MKNSSAFTEAKNIPEAVLNHIENICEENLTSILSQYDGNICDLARRLYAENFGDITFYPWCEKCFDEDDPETYCTGIEVEATFHFDIKDIEDDAIRGTVLVTVYLHENGSLHDIRVSKASTDIEAGTSLMVFKGIAIISEEELLKELNEREKRLYGRLSKREKEEMRFKHSIGPDVDKWTRFTLCQEFSYRPDEDTIDALDIDRVDYKERRIAFMETFRKVVADDIEDPYKTAEYVWRALQTNNAEQLLYALCGYGANDLAKRASIVPDDSLQYGGDEPKPARLVVMWSNGKKTTCRCGIQEEDFKICNFRRKVFQKYADKAEIEGVFVKFKPYASRESIMFSCIDEEERRTYNDMLSYWYSMTPSVEDEDIDPDDDNEE